MFCGGNPMFLMLSPSGRKTFKAELAAGIANSCFIGASALLPVLLKKYFDASNLQLSVFSSVSCIAYLLSIWVNRWTERVSARKIILLAGLIRTGLFSVLGWGQTPSGLIMLFGLP